MNTVTLHLLKLALNGLMRLGPNSKRSNTIDSLIINKTAHTKSTLSGDWQLRELYSETSKLTHRYYYHHGPTPQAPVFLLLHGLFLDGRCFEKMHSLSQRFQLIAYDLPESSPIYRGDMNDFKFLIDDFLDTLKIDKIYLCGVSFGGGIALRYAASHARRVEILVLVSTFIMNITSDDRNKSRELAKTLLVHSDSKLQWLVKGVIKVSFTGNNREKKLLTHLLHLKHIDWYKQVVKSITTCEGSEDALQVKCPVLVLIGDNDRTVTESRARLIPSLIPNAELQIIKNGTHSMMYLQGSLIADRIGRFCSRFDTTNVASFLKQA